MTAPDSDAILARLLTLHPKLVDLSLGRMERLLAQLDNPERRVPPVVHVTGTNGKGSTLAFLRAIMEAAGYRVHAYSSPHLVRFHERIRLSGELIEEAHLQNVLDECEAANGGEEITFFEVTTAAAFLAFSRTPADILLLENGLGGRLDATNVVPRPVLTGITTVSMDHQQFLGDTLEKIAFEKAGIIKQGVPCVIGSQRFEALTVLQDRASAIDAPTIVCGEDWSYAPTEDGMSLQVLSRVLSLPAPVLPGAHQMTNAAMAAVLALSLPDFDVSDRNLSAGLQTADWPARLQMLNSGPLLETVPDTWEVWLDGGHNPDAGSVIARHARAHWADRPLFLIAGMINSKAAQDYFAPMADVVNQVHCITIPGEENAIPSGELRDTATAAGLKASSWASADEAMAAIVLCADAPARVLICGSLYFAGHILRRHG